ncbi:MAG: hypothetical protein JWP87_2388 [Labilithrix sp.]|nr:hypothetical protein [Labilithrix sp.]
MHDYGMPAPHPTFSRLRFAAAVSSKSESPRSSLPTERLLDVPRDEGLDLLDWLGLGRPDFGAIPARELAPRCRRRLWDVPRNAQPSLRTRTGELLAVAEAAGEGMVMFG